MCEECQSVCVTSVCLCCSLVLCIRVSDVMLLAGEIWCNGGHGTQLADTRERERHICLSVVSPLRAHSCPALASPHCGTV